MSAALAKNKPESLSDSAEARVTSLSYDGRGVAHLDGKAVFIEGALPGETVRFRYTQRRKRYDGGAVAEILEPSPNRVTPPCPHFGTCGGCDLQHLRPELQLEAKQRILAEQLERLGKVSPARWLNPISGPALGYRRRARLGVRRVMSAGGVILGFRQKNKSFLTNLEACLVLDARVGSLLPALRALVATLSCPDRIPQIEVACGDAAAALVVRHLVPLTEEDRQKLSRFGQTHGLQMYLQHGRPETIAPLWPEAPPPLSYRLDEFDVEIRFAPADFIQINAAVNAAMVAQALELLDPQPQESVLDLFCGLGNFTLPLARRAGRVLGVENEAGLVARARANAAHNGIVNAEFIAADLYRPDAGHAWAGFTPDKVLLDPPRTGAIEALKALSAPLPAKILYISCYPGTLARDSEYLVHQLGYRLEAAGVLDMFPQTSHLETQALFVRP